MIWFWILAIIFGLIALFFAFIVVVGLKDLRDTNSATMIIAGILLCAVFVIAELALINNWDYSDKKLEALYPEDVTIINEEFCVTIKYYDFKHVIDSKPELPKAQDSCFYINRTEYFDILGNHEITEFKVVITDKKEFKPIKI